MLECLFPKCLLLKKTLINEKNGIKEKKISIAEFQYQYKVKKKSFIANFKVSKKLKFISSPEPKTHKVSL